MSIKTAAELRTQPAGMSITEWFAAVQDARKARWDAMESIVNASRWDGRNLHASEQREYDVHERELSLLQIVADDIQKMPEAQQVDRAGVVPTPRGSSAAYAQDQPLRAGQSFEGFARAFGLVGEDEQDGPLSLRKALRGVVTGDWTGAGRERNAMTGGSGAGGGYLVPTVLSGQIIDLARNQTRVLEAGAQIVPMSSKTVDVARWESDPSAAWHSEGAAIAPSDATLGKVTLTAQTLPILTVASMELLEDAEGVEDQLRQAFAASIALEMDRVSLYGTGTAPEPRGVKNTSGVLTTSMGANGATPTNWDTLVDAVGQLRDNNETPTAIIYADRTARTFAKLKATDNQPLAAPEYLDGIPRLSTKQVPTNLTVGTSTDTSDVFTADWRQLLLGVRTQLQIRVLSERYADTGQIGFLVWFRGDVAVARPKAFHVTTGVRP